MRAIALAHGVGPSSVYRRARAGGWTRDGAAAGGHRAAKPNGAPPVAPATPPVAPATPPVASPTSRHELGRLRALADKLFGRLERMIDGDGEARPGSRESPEALLLKLCQITEKIITMESRLASAETPNASRLSEQDREIIDRYKQRRRVG